MQLLLLCLIALPCGCMFSPEFFTAQGIDVFEGRFELNSNKEPRNPQFQMLRKDLSQLQLINNDISTNKLKNNAFAL